MFSAITAQPREVPHTTTYFTGLYISSSLGGHAAHNTTVDKTFSVTNNRNEGPRYILLSIQQTFLTYFKWF
jgi:hypothetical protein